MARRPDRPEAPPLETLRTLLDSAAHLVGELGGDPLFKRLTAVFAKLPAADREPIVAILEREAHVRLTGEAAGGLSLRPNPSARLYTRILADDPRPNPGRAVQQALRSIQLLHGAVAPMDSEWKAVAREALEHASPEECASIARFARELVALVEERTRSRNGSADAAPRPGRGRKRLDPSRRSR
jgi:hypothetical protein